MSYGCTHVFTVYPDGEIFRNDPEVERMMNVACFFLGYRCYHPNQLGRPYTVLLEAKHNNQSIHCSFFGSRCFHPNQLGRP